MEARIAPAVAPWSPAVQKRFDKVPPIRLFRVLARDERLFARFMDGGFLDRGHLTMRDRELTILRVCALNGSEYEWGVHINIFAKRIGLTDDEIAATTHLADTTIWQGRDALIIRLCDTLQSSCEIEDDFWAELRGTFEELAILEFILLIGKYRQVCLLTNTLRLELEEGAPGFPAP